MFACMFFPQIFFSYHVKIDGTVLSHCTSYNQANIFHKERRLRNLRVLRIATVPNETMQTKNVIQFGCRFVIFFVFFPLVFIFLNFFYACACFFARGSLSFAEKAALDLCELVEYNEGDDNIHKKKNCQKIMCKHK